MGSDEESGGGGGGRLKEKEKEEILSSACSVCGSPAAAHLHYGAVSCYSCRAFFRRGQPKQVRSDLRDREGGTDGRIVINCVSGVSLVMEIARSVATTEQTVSSAGTGDVWRLV